LEFRFETANTAFHEMHNGQVACYIFAFASIIECSQLHLKWSLALLQGRSVSHWADIASHSLQGLLLLLLLAQLPGKACLGPARGLQGFVLPGFCRVFVLQC